MTVTTSSPGQAAPASPYGVTPGARGVRRRLGDTPGRLTLASVVAVVASVGVGTLGFLAGLG